MSKLLNNRQNLLKGLITRNVINSKAKISFVPIEKLLNISHSVHSNQAYNILVKSYNTKFHTSSKNEPITNTDINSSSSANPSLEPTKKKKNSKSILKRLFEKRKKEDNDLFSYYVGMIKKSPYKYRSSPPSLFGKVKMIYYFTFIDNKITKMNRYIGYSPYQRLSAKYSYSAKQLMIRIKDFLLGNSPNKKNYFSFFWSKDDGGFRKYNIIYRTKIFIKRVILSAIGIIGSFYLIKHFVMSKYYQYTSKTKEIKTEP